MATDTERALHERLVALAMRDHKLADPCPTCGNRQLTVEQIASLVRVWLEEIYLPEQRIKWLTNAIQLAAATQPHSRLGIDDGEWGGV